MEKSMKSRLCFRIGFDSVPCFSCLQLCLAVLISHSPSPGRMKEILSTTINQNKTYSKFLSFPFRSSSPSILSIHSSRVVRSSSQS